MEIRKHPLLFPSESNEASSSLPGLPAFRSFLNQTVTKKILIPCEVPRFGVDASFGSSVASSCGAVACVAAANMGFYQSSLMQRAHGIICSATMQSISSRKHGGRRPDAIRFFVYFVANTQFKRFTSSCVGGVPGPVLACTMSSLPPLSSFLTTSSKPTDQPP